MGYSIPAGLLDAMNEFGIRMTDWEEKCKKTEQQLDKLLSQVNELSSQSDTLQNKLKETLEHNKTLLSQSSDWEKSYKRAKDENQILKSHIEKLEKEIAATSLLTTTKNTYLKLILGMAKDKYKYKSTGLRNDATGTGEHSIYTALERLGDDFKVNDDTIRKILQEASELLD